MTDDRRYLPPSATERTKVLYIGGTGRTGSTVLTRVLGRIPGWVPGGELAFLWRHGLRDAGRCSCGQLLVDCSFWQPILSHADLAAVDPQRMIDLRRRCWSVHLPAMTIPPIRRRLFSRLEEFPRVAERLYSRLRSEAGARVIIDSSKEPHYSWILRERTDLDVYFLHLVRDHRGVGHSWQRSRRELGHGNGAQMDTRGSLTAATYYDVSNVAAEAIWASHADRYRLLRYEDFCTDPLRTIDAIGAFVDEPVPDGIIGADRRVTGTDAGHLAWGNPNRFDSGVIDIRDDDAWHQDLPRRKAMALSTFAGPVAARYGYPLVATRPRGRPRRRLRPAMIASPATEHRS